MGPQELLLVLELSSGVLLCWQVFLIERVGRRTLMLYGVGGMGTAFALLTAMFCFQVT